MPEYVEPLLWAIAAVCVGGLVVGVVLACAPPCPATERHPQDFPFATVIVIRQDGTKEKLHVKAGEMLPQSDIVAEQGQAWLRVNDGYVPAPGQPRIFLRDANANGALSVFYTPRKQWPDGKVATSGETWSVHDGVFRRVAGPE